jgi:hypothetical protein
MPADESRIKEIRGLINAAKQQPVHFGLCLGAKPETDTLLMHRNKAAKSLSMEARTEAKGTKVAFGTATVVGSTLNLACEEKPPGGLAKRARTMLKAMKLNLKVRLVGADGEVFEEDGEEEPEAPVQGKSPTGDTPQTDAQKTTEVDPSEAEWKAMQPKLEADVMAFISRGAGDVSRVRTSWGIASEYAGQGDFAGAVKVGTRLTQLLTEGAAPPQDSAAPPPPPPPPPPETKAQPDAAELTRLLMALVPRIPAAAGDNAERKAALTKLATQAQVYLKTNNFTYAQTTIEQLRSELEGGSPPPPPSPPADMGAKLTQALTALTTKIPTVAGQDASLRTTLVGLAQDASAKIKAGDLAGAGKSIASLRDALAGKPSETPEPGQPNLETYRNFAKKWLDTRQQIEDEIEKLRAVLAETYQGDVAKQIDASYRKVTSPVLSTLDGSFALKLEAAGKATAPDERATRLAEARAALNNYRSFTADKLLADLDDNPFTPLTIRSSVIATVTELEAAIA